jgi:hypothetical protein
MGPSGFKLKSKDKFIKSESIQLSLENSPPKKWVFYSLKKAFGFKGYDKFESAGIVVRVIGFTG